MDDEEIGAVNIRHRHRIATAEHQCGRKEFRRGVDAAGRIDIHAAEDLQQRRCVVKQPRLVGDGVADVEADGIGTVLLADGTQSFADQIEGLFPGSLDKFPVTLDQRRLDQIRVIVQFGPGITLGAEETLAQRILVVAANTHQTLGTRVGLHQQAAIGFADRAHAGVNGDIRLGLGTDFASSGYMVHLLCSRT